MALTYSTKMEKGMKAPSFFLQDTKSGNYLSLDDLKSSKATVIMFICNHCPYVIHYNRMMVDIANEFRDEGVSFIAISSNDVDNYPQDGPEFMSVVAKVLKYPFPYLYDKRQEVAKAYGAACTPDYYVFDGNMDLNYHGRMDESSPGNGKNISGDDLINAIRSTIHRNPIEPQYPSMGCSIKWKQ